jgi:hypothetical protein
VVKPDMRIAAKLPRAFHQAEPHLAESTLTSGVRS